MVERYGDTYDRERLKSSPAHISEGYSDWKPVLVEDISTRALQKFLAMPEIGRDLTIEIDRKHGFDSEPILSTAVQQGSLHLILATVDHVSELSSLCDG